MVAQWIRDEIREVSPGVYLGKVYWSDKRLIDFARVFKVIPDVFAKPAIAKPERLQQASPGQRPGSCAKETQP